MPLNPISGRHQWTWTSAEPLQCTSLLINVRSRDEQRTSEWSHEEFKGQIGSDYTLCCKLQKRLCFCYLFFTLKIWSIPSPCLSGRDMPSNAKSQVYPQDKVIPVGASITFCCIVMEGKRFGSFNAGSVNTVVNTTRLSRRTYSAVVVNREPSPSPGTNVICYGNAKELLDGSVMFAGCKTTKPINNTVLFYVKLSFKCVYVNIF